MVTKHDRSDRIAELLEAYGSDVSRWPANERAAMDALPSAERPTQDMARLREAKALDQLLAHAAKVGDDATPPAALVGRILDAAPSRTSGADGIEDERVVVLRPAQNAPTSKPRVVTDGGSSRDRTAAATLLAASLVLGIFVGSTERGQVAAQNVGEIAGLTYSGSTVQVTALDEALLGQDDEDIL